MAKDNREESSGWIRFLHELLKTDIYKRSQGRIVRQVTFFAIWLAFALAAWKTHTYLSAVATKMPLWSIYAISVTTLVVGGWLAFRLVNLATFADFLIAVEAEMNKVSWPSRTELTRASLVVIILMFGLTMVLFAYDNILVALFRVLGIT